MRSTFSVLFAVSLLGSLTTPARAQPTDPEVATLVRGNSDFAVSLYQRLAVKEPSKNLFFSPYSTSHALAMTYAGARGNTAREMKTTLRFTLDDDRLPPAFARLIDHLHGEGKTRPFQLAVANRLWGQRDYDFQANFLKIGRDHYRAELEQVDFVKNTEGTRQHINAWVEKQTQNKIKDLIPQDTLTPLTRLVLTNAIYFKAAWLQPFDPKQTQPGTFHLVDGKTVQANMMHAKESLRFAQFDTFSLVELPYAGEQQSMIVVLPKRKDGLGELEQKISSENLAAWMNRLATRRVDLTLPKFKVTAKFMLNDVMKEMGMQDAFKFGTADFSGMATREKLYITAIVHQAFVDVNEAGTEAAAATAVVVGTKSIPPPATFHADHPFLFLIRDQQTGSILFLGRVMNPSS